MSTIATPEAVARLTALNDLRAPIETFTGTPSSNPAITLARKYSSAAYRQKSRDIAQLGKDQPVTIMNMNPFPLKINGGALFPEDVPACPVDKPYALYVIKQTRWQSKDNGCDMQGMEQMEPIPYVPMTLAAEYIREFVHADYAFGGVMCFVGDNDPATFGKNASIEVPEISYEDGEFFMSTNTRKYQEIFDEVKTKRNNSLLRTLQLANSWYENDHQRHFVNDNHREIARLALHEGLIPELPRWVMQAHMQTEKQADPCPTCQVVPKAGAIMCVNCGQIFNVVEAYKNTRIAYGAVEMDRLTAEEWAIVNKIKAERDKARGVKPQ